ncbi:MAG: hypothetical protein DMG32_15275 [Acidobacteria bacterium]|nr:MAG: hypothetical protein DMG32_15275 [Acidobacteriota bacterium]
MRLVRIAVVVLLPLLPPTFVWSQVAPGEDQNEQAREQKVQETGRTGASESGSSADAQSAVQQVELAPLPLTPPADWKNEHSDHKQTDRMFWVVPNFAAVNPDTELPPLSTRGKFVLAMHDSIDYSAFTWTAILAGQALALRSDPELGNRNQGLWPLFLAYLRGRRVGHFFH